MAKSNIGWKYEMQLSNNETLILYLSSIILSFSLLLGMKYYKLKYIYLKSNKRRIAQLNIYWMNIFICMLPMILLLSVRYNTGADYQQYSWNYITVITGNVFDSSSIFKLEPLYTLSIKFANLVCPNVVQFWFAMIAFFMFINFVIAFYLFELDNPHWFILLFGLFAYLHCFNYVRQMYAASWIMIALGWLIKRNRKIYFVLFIIIATLIHRSSIIFILLWPICKLNKEKNFLYRILMCASPLYLTIIARILFKLSFFSRYAHYFAGTLKVGVGFLIEIIPLMVLMIFCKDDNRENKEISALLNIAWLVIPLRLMSYFSYAAGRLFITCSIFSILAYCLSKQKRSNRIFVTIIFLIYFIIEFYLFNNSDVFPYTFYNGIRR